MSFSKARIQRFNEFENDVPPPGSYDPKFDSKVKGSVIEKTERFHDNKSVASAECNLSVNTKSTSHTIASFRTPQLPRKKKQQDQTPRTVSTSKPRALITSTGDQKLKYDSQHQLADLQVECSNKDRTINELERHVEDVKEEVRLLEMQLEELRTKQSEVEEQHRRDIEIMAKLQQDVLNSYDEKHQTEVENLRCQLLEVSEEKEREKEARKVMENELRSRITELSKKATTLEFELANKKQNNGDKVQSLEAEIEKLVIEFETLTESRKRELYLLEQEKSKLNSCIDDLTDERDDLESKLQKRQSVILELQAQLSTLQCELDELKAEYEKLTRDSAKQIDDLRRNCQAEIHELENDFEEEKEILRNEYEMDVSRRAEIEMKAKDVQEENHFLREELEDVQRLYKDVNNRLLEAHEELEESSRKHELVLRQQKEDLANIVKRHDEETFKLKEQLEDARLMYLKEIENLTMARDKEVSEIEEATVRMIEEEKKRIKQQADRRVENAEAITRETLAACRTECEERVKRVIAESDAKVNAMIREAKATVEEEMRLTAERYKSCLARIEIERAALDDKLAQKDAEITRLSMTLEELKSSAETQESFGQSLQMELDRAETELAEKKEELRALKDQIRAEAAGMVARRKRFEVVMAENQASVTALTKRLAQSNAEVERLQHELKRGEDCINEHRDLLSIMRNNSQMVHEQVHVLMEELDAKKGLVDQLEVESLSEVESLKSIFEAKIDDFKHVATKEIAKLKASCDQKSAQNVEIKTQLDEMARHLADAQSMLLKLEERNDAQELEISRVELTNKKLIQQQKEREAMMDDANKRLEEQSKKHEAALNEANSEIQDLRDTIKSLEETHVEENVELIEEERKKEEALKEELLQKLEEEKARREAAEEEIKKLAEHNKRLMKELQDISEKYAEVVGHHNHRQRIKHVSQLKDKITQLGQDLQGKNRTIEQQQRIIEKFRSEERRAHGKGKENMLGIVKSAHTTPVSSPHKPVTPLRDRND